MRHPWKIEIEESPQEDRSMNNWNCQALGQYKCEQVHELPDWTVGRTVCSTWLDTMWPLDNRVHDYKRAPIESGGGPRPSWVSFGARVVNQVRWFRWWARHLPNLIIVIFQWIHIHCNKVSSCTTSLLSRVWYSLYCIRNQKLTSSNIATRKNLKLPDNANSSVKSDGENDSKKDESGKYKIMNTAVIEMKKKHHRTWSPGPFKPTE